MDPIIMAVIVFVIGFIASFIGGFAAGSGLISIPLLMFAGLPPHVAIATNKVGMFAMKLGAFINYVKAKKIIWSLVLPFSILALVGAVIGSITLVSLDENLVSVIVGIVILLLLPLVLFQKGAGVRRRRVSKTKKRLGYFAYLGYAVWSAFFGGGSGFIALYTYVYFFGTTILECKGTNKIPQFLLDITAIGIFLFYGIVHYLYAIILIVAMAIGGYAGAHMAVKKGENWQRIAIAAVVVLSAIKLIFF
jgi:uncharacterized membrane protein YfcA